MTSLTIEVRGLDGEKMNEAFIGDIEEYFDEGMYRRFNGEHGPNARTEEFEVEVTYETE